MNRIKERRQELGYTQPEISTYLKRVDPRMDVGMVSRFENGACLPTEAVADALCTVLQATKAQLWGEEKTQEMQRKSAEQKAIVELISRTVPFGRENAIKREELARALQVNDRQARHYIGIARLNGVIIVGDQDGGGGYFQTDKIEDIVRQYKREKRRVLSIAERMQPLRSALMDAGIDLCTTVCV